MNRGVKTAVFKYPDSPPAPGRASSFPPTGEPHHKVLGGPHNAASPSGSQHRADSAALLWNPLKIEAHPQALLLWKKSKSKEKLTAKVRRESLSLLCAEKALLPEHGDLGADGVNDAADVEQFELLKTLHFWA